MNWHTVVVSCLICFTTAAQVKPGDSTEGLAGSTAGDVGSKYPHITCPKENLNRPVLLPHSEKCEEFYICDSGVPYPKACPAGLHFNPTLQVCDFPQNAQCDSGNSEKPKGKKKEDDFDERCSSTPKGTKILLPHPYDCSQFLMCDGSIAHPKTCPSGLHFRQEIGQCDYPINVKCSKDGLERSPGIPSPFCPTIDGKVPIFIRHPSNCTIYYMCSHGLAYQFVCPARLHFNVRKKACDYEWLARCNTGAAGVQSAH